MCVWFVILNLVWEIDSSIEDLSCMNENLMYLRRTRTRWKYHILGLGVNIFNYLMNYICNNSITI